MAESRLFLTASAPVVMMPAVYGTFGMQRLIFSAKYRLLVRGGCSLETQNSLRIPNPGSEAGRVQRVRTKTGRKVQSVEQSGRPAGWRLAGSHASSGKSQSVSANLYKRLANLYKRYWVHASTHGRSVLEAHAHRQIAMTCGPHVAATFRYPLVVADWKHLHRSFEQMTIKPINVHATADSKRKLRPGGLSEQVEFLLDAFLAADKAELGATSAAIYGWCCTSCNRR
eukprot:SAG25_NODE_29_length_20738_cov_25.829546_6_plen_227_part_00